MTQILFTDEMIGNGNNDEWFYKKDCQWSQLQMYSPSDNNQEYAGRAKSLTSLYTNDNSVK